MLPCHKEREIPGAKKALTGKEAWQMDIRLTSLSSCAG
jgi:hypothetical protein